MKRATNGRAVSEVIPGVYVDAKRKRVFVSGQNPRWERETDDGEVIGAKPGRASAKRPAGRKRR